MKTIGIIGGLSWQSTQVYYETIQSKASLLPVPLTSAPVLLNSLNFAPIAAAMQDENWHQKTPKLRQAAEQLMAGGADIICLANNTLHCVLSDVMKTTSAEWLSISQPLTDELATNQVNRVTVLGTTALMNSGFYQAELQHDYQLVAITDDDQHRLNRIIFEQLCHGLVEQESVLFLKQLVGWLQSKGVQAIVLACTELTLLAKHLECSLLILDSAELHAKAAFSLATSELG